MSRPIAIPRLAARRFQRRALGIDEKFPSVAAALAYHGYIQIDPINVCGRMHDLILRNRVVDYREGDLTRHLHGVDATLPAQERVAFEHHLPDNHNLVALPLAAWPHLRAAMLARSRRPGAWSGRLTPREQALVPAVLAEIGARGPLASEDFRIEGRAARRVWGQGSLVKSVLQKLFFHGRLLIARREKNRRIYDLPERILPPGILALPPPTGEESARWVVLQQVRQRRLVALPRAAAEIVADAVCAVTLEDPPDSGGPRPKLYCLRSDLPRWDEAVNARDDAAEPRLLAPLDPLIYDRRVTRAVWDFDYTWEVYTPPHRRQRGYYALPILAGTELVGHIDAKADRDQRRLRVVGRKTRRGVPTTAAVAALAGWLGLRSRS